MSDNSYRSNNGQEHIGPNAESNSLSASTQCDLLSDRCRRMVLQYLVSRPGQRVYIEDVVEYVTPRCSTEDYYSVEVSLYHTHLPKLEEAGVIEVYDEEETVEYVPNQNLERLLAVLEEQ